MIVALLEVGAGRMMMQIVQILSRALVGPVEVDKEVDIHTVVDQDREGLLGEVLGLFHLVLVEEARVRGKECRGDQARPHVGVLIQVLLHSHSHSRV